MSDNWTPTTRDVLEAWVAHQAHDQPTALDLVDAYDSFHRWLAAEKVKCQAEALRDAAAWLDSFERPGGRTPHQVHTIRLLRERAARIEKGERG